MAESRVSQVVLEVLSGGGTTNARVSQLVVEVLASIDTITPPAGATQTIVCIITE
jgi:hypothetical protein